jgi:hypothetical protein
MPVLVARPIAVGSFERFGIAGGAVVLRKQPLTQRRWNQEQRLLPVYRNRMALVVCAAAARHSEQKSEVCRHLLSVLIFSSLLRNRSLTQNVS